MANGINWNPFSWNDEQFSSYFFLLLVATENFIGLIFEDWMLGRCIRF
jgi:hypothetical protein